MTSPPRMRELMRCLDPAHRRYLYRIAKAALPILAALGFYLPGDQSDWLMLIAAILNVGVLDIADANVPPRKSKNRDEEHSL